MTPRLAPGQGGISQRIIDDTHALVQQHRASLGLEPWDFTKPRTYEQKAYASYLKWCAERDLPAADVDTWRRVTARVSPLGGAEAP